METHDRLEQWVNERTSIPDLPPGWPNLSTARRRLDARLAAQGHRLWLWAAGAAVCAAVVAFPTIRAAAQRLWDQVVVGRIDVVTTDEDGLAAIALFSAEVQHPPDVHAMSSYDEASQAAGFAPRLPAAGTFSAAPRYSVADVASAKLQLRAAAIRDAVTHAGGAAGEVPDDWDGAILELRMGPVIIADYDGTVVLQSLPFELMTPAGFDLELFYRLAFRAFGMSEPDARILGADLGLRPAVLTFMPKEDRKLLREVKTSRGAVVMIDEVYGRGKTVALWSRPDRMYAVFVDRELATPAFVAKVANALD